MAGLIARRLAAGLICVGFAAPALAESPPPLRELKKLGKLPEIGKRAPRFRLYTQNREALVKLSDRAYPGREKSYSKKRPVLLDFFRTDCSPCRAAMPELIAFAKAHESEGLEVIIVALLEQEDGQRKLDEYLAQEKLPFVVVIDAHEHVGKKYLGGTAKLPATFLIDANGTLVARRLGAAGELEAAFGPALRTAVESAGNEKR